MIENENHTNIGKTGESSNTQMKWGMSITNMNAASHTFELHMIAHMKWLDDRKRKPNVV